MKKLFLTLVVLLNSIPLFAMNVPYESQQEFRGIWVITWEIFKKDGKFLRGEELKKNIDSILENVKRSGLNTLLWQVRQGGTVYYPSELEPWGRWVEYRAMDFDPLEYAIDRAHKMNLKIHAWINTFEARDQSPGTPANLHPEWICRDKEGNPMPQSIGLSPGLSSVREHIEKVVLEVTTKYEVDGIHMDYIRWSEYPMGEDGVPDNSRPLYQYDLEHPYKKGIPAGYDSWESFRREQVTIFVKGLHEQLKSLKPWVVFSVAAIGKYNWGFWNGYHIVGQDAALWLNEGYIDHIMGMNYAWTSKLQMQGGLSGDCPNCWEIYIQKGLAEGRSYTPGIGSLMLRNRNLWENHKQLIQGVREVPWVLGMQFFSYGDWLKMDFFDQAKKIFDRN